VTGRDAAAAARWAVIIAGTVILGWWPLVAGAALGGGLWAAAARARIRREACRCREQR
jgi:hypothetical protein